jgi:hypothetical protein
MIVAITGPPAAGKTSLAVPLARALDLPLYTKDVIKEALFDELGTSADPAWSRRLSDASYRVVINLLRGAPSAVIDLNLPREWAPEFVASGRRFVQIFCRCSQPELERRLLARATSRHPVHRDDAVLDDIRSQGVRGYDPAPLPGPLLEVETEATVDLVAVTAWVRDHLSRRELNPRL